MDLGLSGKVVFITGASGGIGRALAEAFAAEGARVALHGHRQWQELQDWLAQQDWRERAMAVQADITDSAAVDAAMQAVCKQWGRVDVCVANAGIWPPQSRSLVELDDERIRAVVGVNLFGAIWTARAFMRALEQSGARDDGDGAALVFTGSTAAHFGEAGHCDYAASKAGLAGLMRSLKNEIVAIDPYARVNIVEPGWTVTEMTRRNINEPGVVEKVVRSMAMRQLARARDIARMVVVLASPEASRHVSGQVVTVAGGMEGRVLWETEDVDAQAVIDRLK